MNLVLVKASKKYKKQIIEMLEEWEEYNDTHVTNHSPGAIFRPHDDFDKYLEMVNEQQAHPTNPKYVPSSTFYALDLDRNIMIGAVGIRHYLNESLLQSGGHIGDGVRPSERRKGYATEIIRLALLECQKLGIDKVLMTCDKDNIGSAKSIINNGGVLENEFLNSDGVIEQRYWIYLK